MRLLLFIAGGGALGSVARYLLSTSVYRFFGQGMPIGTLTVNVLGSFLIGFLSVILIERFDNMSAQLWALLIVGFLGGFTTFSAFSLETLHLIENGALLKAGLNVLLSLGLCLCFTWLGLFIARQI